MAKLQEDSVDVYVFDPEEARRLIELWEGGGELATRLAASYAATAIDVKEMLREMGAFIAKAFKNVRIEYRVQTYAARTVLILRAGPAFRQVIVHSSTVFSIKPQAVRFAFARVDPAYAMGKARNAVKSGGVLTIVLVTGFHVIDHLMSDESTWQRLASRVSADIATIGASVAFSAVAVNVLGGSVAALSFGPLGVAIMAGIAAGFFLEEFEVSSRLAIALEGVLNEILERNSAQWGRLRSEWDWWHANPMRELEFWRRVFGAQY